jgi:hypothetical protein
MLDLTDRLALTRVAWNGDFELRAARQTIRDCLTLRNTSTITRPSG